ncbi:MAG: beta-glucosidase BglX [Clostridia bacterium]|nr:beta-glucosidase BglX [Clostridia bacterium]
MARSDVDVKKLLAQMTLEEKVGQLVQLNAMFLGESSAEITGPLEKLGIPQSYMSKLGSTLNFHGAQEMMDIQRKHLEEDRNHIPLMFMMDVIHGFRTIFPIPLGLGASFDPETVKECSRMAAREASAGGVQVTFTPMVDYVRDARWGRVMESCGEDPYLNSVMGAAQVEAFQGDDLADHDNIAACVKHFAAYGGAEAGRDYNTVEISERLLREYYLPAYKACIDAGVKMLMPSFNSLNGVPSIANKWLMNKVLKDEWGFDGVIISDYNAIGELKKHGITDDMRLGAKMAFDCGCDIEMMSSSYYKHLADLVNDGEISEQKLDEAVLRVLELKKELGLFEDPYHGASPEKENSVCLTPEHRDIARRAAEASAVLLKNDGILPLSEDIKRIALVGPFAATNEIKGSWSCNGENEDCVSVYEGIRSLLPNAEIIVAEGCSAKYDELSEEGIDAAVAAAKGADAVVLCLGEPQKYSGEGNSRADIGLPGIQMQLARKVIAANPNAVALTFSGRPLVLTELDKLVPAILHMWFPGTEGGSAAADLLFGRANPSGKVPMSFPKAVGQCPIYYNHPSTGRPKSKPDEIHQPYSSNYIGCGNLPLYPFGHGLSYSSFVYESLELDTDTMTKDSEITVSITVLNDSDRAGKEVVQLYMHDIWASAVRPIQSLIAFEKTELGAHERKTITFKVREPMLRFYDLDCNHISEPGEFTLSTGCADHLVLTKSFTLK